MLLSLNKKSIINFQKPNRPPFKWSGSKTKMLKKYESCGFWDMEEPKLFLDVMSGSTVMSLWARKKFPNMEIVINDKNSEMINMYKNIRDHKDIFKNYFKGLIDNYQPLSFDDRYKYYYDLRNDYRLENNLIDPVDESAKLLFLLITGFCGVWQTMKTSGDRYATSRGTLDEKNIYPKLNHIDQFHDFLKTCIITDDDFNNTGRWVNQGTFVYCDPPYRESFAEYESKQSGGFTDTHQLQLIEYMKNCHNSYCKVAMSNREFNGFKLKFLEDNNTSIDPSHGWFSDKFNDYWNVTEFTDIHYSTGRGKGLQRATEILIKNY